ncbi:hypothetical protein F511_18326 [Dorcoceras hygrometricum]|uniref:Uncharacterized protein n=1 Tax=Dorcoceras hygrometricum TaxID=472368 RepID=A0A2Z7CNN4_9LAMI|nr:hypothetical protein F511_18326 [Dorcoceras hygrometricum]
MHAAASLTHDNHFQPFVIPDPATMAGAHPDRPPPGPADSNDTSHCPNRVVALVMVAAGSRRAIVRVIEEATRVWFEEPVVDEKRCRLIKWKCCVLSFASGTSSELCNDFGEDREAADFFVQWKPIVIPLVPVPCCDWPTDELCLKSPTIIGVVTTGFECLPPSCDELTGSEDHGPMISPVDIPCGTGHDKSAYDSTSRDHHKTTKDHPQAPGTPLDRSYTTWDRKSC